MWLPLEGSHDIRLQRMGVASVVERSTNVPGVLQQGPTLSMVACKPRGPTWSTWLTCGLLTLGCCPIHLTILAGIVWAGRRTEQETLSRLGFCTGAAPLRVRLACSSEEELPDGVLQKQVPFRNQDFSKTSERANYCYELCCHPKIHKGKS